MEQKFVIQNSINKQYWYGFYRNKEWTDDIWITKTNQNNGGANLSMHIQNIENNFGELGKFQSYAKWSDIYEDMKMYSLQYPDTLFRFQCDEEHGFRYYQYFFMNGKGYRDDGYIIYNYFDETKLEDIY